MPARKMNIKLPPGLAVGMRIATNKRYNVCYPRVARERNGVPRTGTIMAGTMRCGDGTVMVLLDDQRHSHPLELKLFDVIEAENSGNVIGKTLGNRSALMKQI